MPRFRTLDALDPHGKRVLVRVDLNVPVKDGRITDRTRIERLLPTIRELAEAGARVVVLSHFDRPKGKVVPEMSLRPMAEALAATLGRPVAFVAECVGAEAEAAVAKLADGEVLLCENTRFHAGEEANDPAMAAALAEVLYNLVETCRLRAVMIWPVLPGTSEKIFAQLKVCAEPSDWNQSAWGGLQEGHQVGAPVPLFPRKDLPPKK